MRKVELKMNEELKYQTMWSKTTLKRLLDAFLNELNKERY